MNKCGKKPRLSGFSLVELLMALMVTGIILTAVVTLAFALNAAYDNTSDISEKQARIRYVTLNISELIGHSKLVCADFTDLAGDLVIWRKDDNGDNKINISEIVYIETGYDGSYLRLLQFYPASQGEDVNISLGWIQWWYYKNMLTYRYPKLRTTLLETCEGMEIVLDKAPPYTTFVNIKFNIEEDSQLRTYQIGTQLRCWAGNLIGNPFTLVTDDD